LNWANDPISAAEALEFVLGSFARNRGLEDRVTRHADHG
jgi:hypothetical protein